MAFLRALAKPVKPSSADFDASSCCLVFDEDPSDCCEGIVIVR
jgi:hypothetical protein